MDLKLCQKLCSESKVVWTQHCLERMQERDISRTDVTHIIKNGEVIEDYPDDFPYPSCLIFGYTMQNKAMHIVIGCDNLQIYIITAYYPDIMKYKDDLKTRRRSN